MEYFWGLSLSGYYHKGVRKMFFSKSPFKGNRMSSFFTLKKFIFTAFLYSLSHYSYADSLDTLSDLKQVLNKGERVNMTVDLTQCANPETGATGTMKGGLVINSYLIRPDGSLAFSDTRQTVSNESKPVAQILRYRSKDEYTITFSMRLFSLPDWQPVGNSVQYDCLINKGIIFYSHD
ncbi:VirK family protein [Brenneria izbisi]|nr:VirK family protein [Brenneria izbisi]MCV9879193.1 VirK family protein [Brenneria izbisi]